MSITVGFIDILAFLLDWAQMLDLDFGLNRQNIFIKKASFQFQGCPLSLKSGKLGLNSLLNTQN